MVFLSNCYFRERIYKGQWKYYVFCLLRPSIPAHKQNSEHIAISVVRNIIYSNLFWSWEQATFCSTAHWAPAKTWK